MHFFQLKIAHLLLDPARKALHAEHKKIVLDPAVEMYRMRFDILRTLSAVLSTDQSFPKETALINKGYLTEALKSYEKNRQSSQLSSKDFYRDTYCLYLPEDRQAFLKQLPEQDHKDNLWIYKPGNDSRGRGIEILLAI